ncbi:MAG: helix-hairpin-helix domain-containing protein [Anaerolineae bacterium]
MAEVVASDEPDDLTKIEGIGPKMSAALIDAGINTYIKLTDANNEQLTQAIQNAGMRLAPSLETWAEQAAYAAKGDWDGLAKLQEELQGGRRVD